MAKGSDFLEEKILKDIFCVDTNKIHLYVTNPADSGTGTEINGLNYEPQPIYFGEPSQVDGKGSVSNTNLISFPEAGNNWGNIAFWAVVDSDENMLIYGEFESVRDVQTSDIFSIGIGSVIINCD